MQLDKTEQYVVDRLLEMRVVNARNKPVEIESGDKLLAGHSKQYKGLVDIDVSVPRRVFVAPPAGC